MTNRLALPAALTLVLLTTTADARAARYSERFEQTFPASVGTELRLTNTNGSVSVEIWERDKIELVAEKSVDSRSRRDAEEVFDEIEIVVDQRGSRIEIETRQPSASDGFFDWLFGRSRSASVSYEIRVPAGVELALRTVNGSITTDGSGRQTLRSTNGRITVEGARDAVEAHTTNGSIRVEVIEASDALEVDLGSTNGSITLAVPAGAGARIAARTVNGSVRSELPLTVEGAVSRKRLSGEINSGGPGSIELRTTNGSIRIERSRL